MVFPDLFLAICVSESHSAILHPLLPPLCPWQLGARSHGHCCSFHQPAGLASEVEAIRMSTFKFVVLFHLPSDAEHHYLRVADEETSSGRLAQTVRGGRALRDSGSV